MTRTSVQESAVPAKLSTGQIVVFTAFVFAALIALIGFIRALPILLSIPQQVDFAAYFIAARVLASGGDIYADATATQVATAAGIQHFTDYIYPPHLAALLMLIASVPYETASRVWLVTNVAVAAVSVLLLCWHLKFSPAMTTCILAGFLLLPATYNALGSGQVLFWINLFFVLMFVLSSRSPSLIGGEVATGMLLAGASVIKIYPAVVGVVFLLQRRWGVMVAALCTGTVMLLLAIDDSWRWLTVVLPGLADANGFPTNQSILGVSTRFLSPIQFNLPDGLGSSKTVEVPPLLFHAPQMGAIMGYAAMVVVLVVSIMAIVRVSRRNDVRPNAFETAFAIGVATALLISPIAWSEYAIQLLIPVVVLMKLGWLGFPKGLVLALIYFLLVLEKHWPVMVSIMPTPLVIMSTFSAVLLTWIALLWVVFARSTTGLARNVGAVPQS
ncbi:MAG: DUF2029 domain-containing protein [Anaerolineales bacterium]|nr:DUF2029 domain-containing protein [Anaerolineales bacterium]